MTVMATKQVYDLSDEDKLELLALSKIAYEIPSKSFWALSEDGNYNIMRGNSVRVIELDGNGKESRITVLPKEMPIDASEAFIKQKLSYTVSLYSSDGKAIDGVNSQKKACQLKVTYTCNSKNVEEKVTGELKQWKTIYDGFSIKLPKTNKKIKYFIVFEPSDKSAVSEIKASYVNVNEPNKEELEIISNKLFYEYFGLIKKNTNVTSKDFLDKIHPGKLYSVNGKNIWWKDLIKSKLNEYIYAENNEETDIKGYGFFAATFLNEKKKTAVIAYRGTEFSKDIEDVLTDADMLIREPAQFRRAKSYYDYIRNKYKEYNVLLTGHSLGGALACYVTFENLGKKQITYTPDGYEYGSYPNSPVSVAFNGAVGYALESCSGEIKKEVINNFTNHINIVTDGSKAINNAIISYYDFNEGYKDLEIFKFNKYTALAYKTIRATITGLHYSGYGVHRREYRKFIKNYVKDSNIIIDVPGGITDTHGMNGLVVYEDGKFTLTPICDFSYE